MHRRHRKMTGGFLESLSAGLSNAWNSTKKATTDAYSSATGSTTTSSYMPTTTTTTTTPTTTSSSGYMGGRKRKRTRRMRGGYSDNTPLTGLAASAAPISGVESAKPHTIIGGKRRTKKRRSHRHSKSCKKCKH